MSSLDNSHTFWHTILYIVAKVVCVCYTLLFAQFFSQALPLETFLGGGLWFPFILQGDCGPHFLCLW